VLVAGDAYFPMSWTAIIWSTVSGFTPTASLLSWSAGRNHGDAKFSMKKTGRRIVQEGKPAPRTVSSTLHLFSKCGIPVFRFADPTDV
jgi:hypothetical protein